MKVAHSQPRARARLLLAAACLLLTVAIPFGTVVSGATATTSATGSANAICSYNHATWRLHWSGAAAGWQRGDLDWELDVYSSSGQKLTALHHEGTFYNSTGGTTASYSQGLTAVPWMVRFTVSGPGGTETDDCWAL